MLALIERGVEWFPRAGVETEFGNSTRVVSLDVDRQGLIWVTMKVPTGEATIDRAALDAGRQRHSLARQDPAFETRIEVVDPDAGVVVPVLQHEDSFYEAIPGRS